MVQRAESNGKKSHQILWFLEEIEQFHSSHVIFWKYTSFKCF